MHVNTSKISAIGMKLTKIPLKELVLGLRVYNLTN